MNQIRAALAELKNEGATFEDCLAVFGVPAAQSAHAKAVIELRDDDLKVDEHVVVSPAHGGAWVSAWHYVTDEDAEVDPLADDLIAVCDAARNALAGARSAQIEMYLDWVDDLIHEARLLSLIQVCQSGEPASVFWVTENGGTAQFLASAAMGEICELARYGDVVPGTLQRVQDFLRENTVGIDHVCGRIYRATAELAA